ncbi:FHA domain-containing protein [Haliangium ochraceum]|uniref:FHA domain containing protein n=1 Tax=Haliangium ochraceum (strain DSM 14365 / JCM 11303 / SMP-2) TaxID=502025 RepID=D0LND2_HALO1|nr:FHA domain-containing protein [Haliangium ochraceum]ACY15309.1 FHA domain containing protein [Haliangium ochraceum DSM 14365]
MSTLERSAPSKVSTVRNDVVGGLRIVRTLVSKLILFDSIRYKAFPKASITLGRTVGNDIRIRNGTISSKHCYISRTDDGQCLLIDAQSRNGVFVDEPMSDDRRWRRVSTVRLKVGMRIRLGDVRAMVTDTAGRSPLVVASESDFCRQAVTYYGTPTAASKATGFSLRRLKRLIKRETS